MHEESNTSQISEIDRAPRVEDESHPISKPVSLLPRNKLPRVPLFYLAGPFRDLGQLRQAKD